MALVSVTISKDRNRAQTITTQEKHGACEMCEIGDPRNGNSAVNRRSVYMDRGTAGLAL